MLIFDVSWDGIVISRVISWIDQLISRIKSRAIGNSNYFRLTSSWCMYIYTIFVQVDSLEKRFWISGFHPSDSDDFRQRWQQIFSSTA
jgi:hypothetical protein